ncbi:MAG: putative glycoside hydrolase [Patescibacteria group bacterium]|jgi:hypothetical protein
MPKFRLNIIALLTVASLLAVAFSFKTATDAGTVRQFPRLANYYLETPITDDQVPQLAKWDLLILGVQAQTVCPEQIRKIRALNPKIKILAYVLSEEFRFGDYQQIESPTGPYHQILAGIQDGWWMLQPDGSRYSFWPGHQMINVTDAAAPNSQGDRWNTYLPKLMHAQVMSTGLWDGIFYDNVWGSLAWQNNGNFDINRDGQKDDPAVLNQAWNAGMRKMLALSRQLEGPGAIIIGNGSNEFKESLNGRLIEGGSWSDWTTDQQNYVDFMRTGLPPQSTVVNNNTQNLGGENNYRLMRFGLTSTLLDNGYYSFDWGTEDHSQLWWYDEYNVDLGRPTGAAYNLDNSSAAVARGFWRRDFENGVVFVNATAAPRVAILGEEELEKISGGQDRAVNDGSRINFVRLGANEGLMVLRPLSEIIGSPFTNGYFVRVFNTTGVRQRGGFYTYKKQFAGSAKIITSDIDADGEWETVVASGGRVAIYGSSGLLEKAFWPYGAAYRGAISLAAGETNNDGWQEIVTAPGAGGVGAVKIFNWQGENIGPNFYVYGDKYRGGVNLALGDLDGNGASEIIVGAATGGPQLRIFNGAGKLISAGWFAYDKNQRGGVRIAAGDLTGDGRAEIVTVPGVGQKAEIKVWNSRGVMQGQPWLALAATNRSGAEVAVNDINRDGIMEILVSSLNTF